MHEPPGSDDRVFGLASGNPFGQHSLWVVLLPRQDGRDRDDVGLPVDQLAGLGCRTGGQLRLRLGPLPEVDGGRDEVSGAHDVVQSQRARRLHGRRGCPHPFGGVVGHQVGREVAEKAYAGLVSAVVLRGGGPANQAGQTAIAGKAEPHRHHVQQHGEIVIVAITLDVRQRPRR